MSITIINTIIFIITIRSSLQNCPEEIFHTKLSVTWHESPPAFNVKSSPLCYRNDHLITRDCNNEQWLPALENLEPCQQIVKYFDLSSCPPGFHSISNGYNAFCYQINNPSAWDYPCFRSGGASVITDLSANEIKSLLKSLSNTTPYRFFWLPARRQKLFNPVTWSIPGPNWGGHVRTNSTLRILTSMFNNCLLLDIQNGIIITDSCNKVFPSLCFYVNDQHYPEECPDGYHAFRFMREDGTCFGIESNMNGTFDDFYETRCKKPLGNSRFNNDLTRFIFKKMAVLYMLPNDQWCWFASLDAYESEENRNETYPITDPSDTSARVAINMNGTLSLFNKSSTLACMACETEVIYEKTELMIEYNNIDKQIYLTIYHPSGLWKYYFEDKGVQCFSDAKGFVRVAKINDIPLIDLTMQKFNVNDSSIIEKVTYIINLMTDRSAQYWCEGHTRNFTFISTKKVVVNPQGNNVHVFSLIVKVYICTNEDHDRPDFSIIISNMTNIFNAENVILMDIFEYTKDYMLILLHLHISVEHSEDHKSEILLQTYKNLKEIAKAELPKYNYTFFNLSSSFYCLPTTTKDINNTTLDWELTLIGHIAAPKQFCLQSNGLPVKRFCSGSYHLGGFWSAVEGFCDETYEPTNTTTFLYNFVKGHISYNYTHRFLIDGLNFVLSDIDIIIPADIYYLSMSFQHILNMVHKNESTFDLGDIYNIAWAMDRVMVLDNSYLRLAQTLNSTNVILDSVNDIIEKLAYKDAYNNSITKLNNMSYQLAIKPQFIVQISYPLDNNITGICLIKNTSSDKFTDMAIRPLYKNTSLDDVVLIKNLEVAAWIPVEVLRTLRKNCNETCDNITNETDIHIVISIYHNDAVFQELDKMKHKLNSRIVGISVPGFISNLEYGVPLVFREISSFKLNKICGYWDFQAQKSSGNPGFWTNNGCYLVNSLNNLTVCRCYHLTHFGQLMNIGGNHLSDDEVCLEKRHMKALNMITLVGCFLSLLGVVGIWVTAMVFQTWRKKAGTKVLLQLSTAISLPLIIMIIYNLDNTIFIQHKDQYFVASNRKYMCIILGVLLHYSILASFMWMLIAAILQFIRYVRVLGVSRPSRFMIKFTLIGWGIPIVPALIILLVDKENYIPNPSNGDRFKNCICYPSGYYLLFGIIAPICLILIINVILFVLVLYAIAKGPDGKMRTTDIDLIGAQLRLSVFLFFLLGLTWLFGIFSFSKNLIWSYLFCLTSTIQGFVLFIYFIICDPSTRNMWITLMKPQFNGSSSRNSISISSG